MSKTYLIIGATSGIGLALKSNLINRGDRVIDASRNGELKFNATKDELDLSKLPEVLDGLIYCPGTINLKPFHRLTVHDFEEDFQTNVVGAVRVIQSVLPYLKRSEQASIVLFSTVAVSQGMPFHASVATAKGALEGLTKSLAAELAPKIRVNCIAPSLTDTPLASKILSSDEKRKASAERHPLKTVGSPQDIASMAAFLLSTNANWISGQILHVDGGLSSLRV
jgi:3-oxoacyl-[acyl-carrier protein] reductase